MNNKQIRVMAKMEGRPVNKILPFDILNCGFDIVDFINFLCDKGYLFRSNGYSAISFAKVPDLKKVLKDNNLKATGEKQELINKLEQIKDRIVLGEFYWILTEKAKFEISEYNTKKEHARNKILSFCKNDEYSLLMIKNCLILCTQYLNEYCDPLTTPENSNTDLDRLAKRFFKIISCNEKEFKIKKLVKLILFKDFILEFHFRNLILEIKSTFKESYSYENVSQCYIMVMLYNRLLLSYDYLNLDYKDLIKIISVSNDELAELKGRMNFNTSILDSAIINIKPYEIWLTASTAYVINEQKIKDFQCHLK